MFAISLRRRIRLYFAQKAIDTFTSLIHYATDKVFDLVTTTPIVVSPPVPVSVSLYSTLVSGAGVAGPVLVTVVIPLAFLLLPLSDRGART